MPQDPPRICDVEPFLYQATPQQGGPGAIGDIEGQGASANQINEQALEAYLNRLRDALCLDIQEVIDECCNGGGGGAENFLALDDTPASYVGASLQVVRVNAGANALEFAAAAGGALPNLNDNTTIASGRTVNGNATSFRLVYQAGFMAAGTVDIVHSLGAFTDAWIVMAVARRPDTTPAQWLHLPHVHQATVGFNINMFVRAADVRIVQGASWTGINPNRLSEPRILLEFY